MRAEDQLPGFEQLCQRHDLMVQLYRVDHAAESARIRKQSTRLEELEQLRDRLSSSLSRLCA